jgi:hypothetical protein
MSNPNPKKVRKSARRIKTVKTKLRTVSPGINAMDMNSYLLKLELSSKAIKREYLSEINEVNRMPVRKLSKEDKDKVRERVEKLTKYSKQT